MTVSEKANDRERARVAALERVTRDLLEEIKSLQRRITILEAIAKVDNKPKDKAP